MPAAKHKTPTLSFALALASNLAAQLAPVSCDFSPDVAAPGQPVQITLYNGTDQTWQVPACDWFTIYASDPATGRPILTEWIEHRLICTLAPRSVPPRDAIYWSWDQLDHCPGCGLSVGTPPYPNPVPVPPGRYWFHVHPPGVDEWFCYTIQAPSAPHLTMTSPARIGGTARFAVRSPNDANEAFGAFLSFSQNQPIGVVPGLGIDLCLAPPLYTVGAGLTLDGNGRGVFSLPIPYQVELVDHGFHVQVLTSNPANLDLAETNSVAVAIRG